MVEETLEREFRIRESDLLRRGLDSDLVYSSTQARRHLREGFSRRLLLMQTNRLEMIKIAPIGRTDKLSTYECGDLNVHVNSWYVHLRGGLDNLAWAMHYEWKLLGNGDEDDARTQRRCHLFGTDFRRAVSSTLPSVAPVLEHYAAWAGDFKSLRDPIAHRVPMYAVPAVAFDEDKKLFESLNLDATAAASVGDFDTFRDKLFKAQEVGTYYHVFVVSRVDGLEIRRLPVQLAIDAKAFFSIAEAIVNLFQSARLRD